MFKDSVDLSFKDGFCACVRFCAGCRGVCVGSVVLERERRGFVCVWWRRGGGGSLVFERTQTQKLYFTRIVV